jgi:DNA invertase Pin-like site-specific DNA recombinase
MLIGYARTSTVDQKAGLSGQHRDLEAAGCTKIFSEEISSVAAHRGQLEAAIDFAREGDTFIVTKLDRLARSVAHLLDITGRLTAKGVSLRIISMQMDTSTPTGKLMLTMLGGIAEFERELMLERQKEGIAKAKADGKYKGRKPTAMAKKDQIIKLRNDGLTIAAIVEQTGVSRSSVHRIIAG